MSLAPANAVLPWERPISDEVKALAHLNLNDLTAEQIYDSLVVMMYDTERLRKHRRPNTLFTLSRATGAITTDNGWNAFCEVVNNLVRFGSDTDVQEHLSGYQTDTEWMTLMLTSWRMREEVQLDEVVMSAALISRFFWLGITLGEVAVLCARGRQYPLAGILQSRLSERHAEVMCDVLLAPSAPQAEMDIYLGTRRKWWSNQALSILHDLRGKMIQQGSDGLDGGHGSDSVLFWLWVAGEFYSDKSDDRLELLRGVITNLTASDEITDEILALRAIGMKSVVRCLNAGVADIGLMAAASDYSVDPDILRALA